MSGMEKQIIPAADVSNSEKTSPAPVDNQPEETETPPTLAINRPVPSVETAEKIQGVEYQQLTPGMQVEITLGEGNVTLKQLILILTPPADIPNVMNIPTLWFYNYNPEPPDTPEDEKYAPLTRLDWVSILCKSARIIEQATKEEYSRIQCGLPLDKYTTKIAWMKLRPGDEYKFLGIDGQNIFLLIKRKVSGSKRIQHQNPSGEGYEADRIETMPYVVVVIRNETENSSQSIDVAEFEIDMDQWEIFLSRAARNVKNGKKKTGDTDEIIEKKEERILWDTIAIGKRYKCLERRQNYRVTLEVMHKGKYLSDGEEIEFITLDCNYEIPMNEDEFKDINLLRVTKEQWNKFYSLLLSEEKEEKGHEIKTRPRQNLNQRIILFLSRLFKRNS